jgi:hypothetical protein
VGSFEELKVIVPEGRSWSRGCYQVGPGAKLDQINKGLGPMPKALGFVLGLERSH